MEIIIGIVGLIIGAGIAFVILSKKNSSKANTVLADARKEAEQIKKEKLLQAKEKFIELKSEHEKLINKNKNNGRNNSRIGRSDCWWRSGFCCSKR